MVVEVAMTVEGEEDEECCRGVLDDEDVDSIGDGAEAEDMADELSTFALIFGDMTSMRASIDWSSAHGITIDHHAHDHTHDPGVSSVSIVCEGSLDLEKANMWLGTLLMERSDDIYRMKGLLSVDGMDERFVFQGVHDIFQGSPDRLWGPEEPRINKVVFIGKNLDAQELEKGFKTCLLPQ
ncbi:uncharacterized protein A4U43_C08F16140 [Asparagus officinalis]|nr:uncharacterized protein A4U43_C08F16140 [Asparagus officinalis]